jgi:hypothetical protein
MAEETAGRKVPTGFEVVVAVAARQIIIPAVKVVQVSLLFGTWVRNALPGEQ